MRQLEQVERRSGSGTSRLAWARLSLSSARETSLFMFVCIFSKSFPLLRSCLDMLIKVRALRGDDNGNQMRLGDMFEGSEEEEKKQKKTALQMSAVVPFVSSFRASLATCCCRCLCHWAFTSSRVSWVEGEEEDKKSGRRKRGAADE